MKHVDIEEERLGLELRAKELRLAIKDEWQSMSWQVARQRQEELESIGKRVEAINRMVARRKRK